MKKLFLVILLSEFYFDSYSQINYQRPEDYQVTVGTSKNSAAIGKEGFTIKGTDIRIVGFLYRGDKIEYDSLYIETTRGKVIVDSLIIPCCGISKKWRDFYIKLSDVVYSDNYNVSVYTYRERKYLRGKNFFINSLLSNTGSVDL